MSEVMMKWLNNEVELQQVITSTLIFQQVSNIERDFANGYLIANLLHKFKQLSNITDFELNDGVTAKRSNFEKLEPVLRNLKVKFNSTTAIDIMNGKRGIALQLLLQLRMALEKVYPQTDIAVLRNTSQKADDKNATGRLGDNKPALAIVVKKDIYDDKRSDHFKMMMKKNTEPEKNIRLRNHLRKFEEEKERQERMAHMAEKEQQNLLLKMSQDRRKAQISKIQRNAGFMEEWQQNGVENWKKNMQIKKEREERELQFTYKQTQNFRQTTLAKVQNETGEVLGGIDKFENKLRQTGIVPYVANEEDSDEEVLEMARTVNTQKQGMTGFSQGTKKSAVLGGMTMGGAGTKNVEKRMVSDKAKKDRERRRRKQIVDQSKTHMQMEHRNREDQIVQRMQQKSKQEEELFYEEWRTHQCKNIITENRQLREVRYEKRREIDLSDAQKREEEKVFQMQQQMKRDIEMTRERDHDMRIFEKQAHRERRTDVGEIIFDAIFEIANEAYIHQQKSDTEDLDPRNWREWQQLFIEGKQIQGVLSSLIEPSTETSENNVDLDSRELCDYLENKGQWRKEIVSDNLPNFQQIMQGADAAPAGAKGGKGKGPAADTVALEEAELQVPEEAENNFYLGDAVEQIICLNHEQRAKIKKPQNPHHLPLKLAIVGLPFAGKRTQAELIAQKYNLNVYKMEELVELAIEYADVHTEPIVKTPSEQKPIEKQESQKAESVKEGEETAKIEGTPEKVSNAEEGEGKKEEIQIENQEEKASDKREPEEHIEQESQLSTDSEAEDIPNPEEDFRLVGVQIKDAIFEGEEITDELYVDLFIAAIRMKFPHKDKKLLRTELKEKVKQEDDLIEQIAQVEREQAGEVPLKANGKPGKAKKPEVLAEMKEKMQADLKELQTVIASGFILVDFPSSFAQAKLLEKKLSGFEPGQEMDPIEREKSLKDASQLARPTPKEDPPKTLIPSGLDSIIWLQTDRFECMRRAYGRRYDMINEKMFHVEDIIPPTTMAPLCERMKPIENPTEQEAILIDRCLAFDQAAKGMKRWLEMFGVEAEERNLVQQIDGQGKQEEVFERVANVVEVVLQSKQNKEDSKKEAIREKKRQLLAAIEQAKRLKEEEEERLRKEEEERLLREKLEAEEAEKEAAEAPKKGGKASKPASKAVTPAQVPKTPANEEKTPVTEKEQEEEKKLPGRDNLDNDFRPVLLNMWEDLLGTYKEQAKKVFREARTQRERIKERIHKIQTSFLEFLHRPDNKQDKLDEFVVSFNKFSEEFPDLREDDQTKEELHQRIDILSDELWEIIEERRDQALEEMKQVKESGYIEQEQELLSQATLKLMQTEVDKFRTSIQLIHDYYFAIDEKLVCEAPEKYQYEILNEGDELPAVEVIGESETTYPRIDEFLKRALKAQAIPDVTQQAAADPKKGNPKDKKKGAAVEEEKPTEVSPYEIEMKDAIKVEKSILRFRLAQVRNWALARLQDMRSKAIVLYQKLDDWIAVSADAENSAVDEMVEIVKEAIESEIRIEDELRLKFMDFSIDRKVKNYIDPPPEKLPELEKVSPDRFTIPQLKNMVSDLKTLANEEGLIANNQIVELFMRKIELSRKLSDDSGVPESWNQLQKADFIRMTRALDKYNRGSVDFQQLSTFIALLSSPVCSDQQGKEIISSAKEGEFDLYKFEIAEFWFNQREKSEDRDYSLVYERLLYLKRIIFELFQKDGQVAAKKFATVVQAKELLMFNKEAQTYSQLLFGVK